MRRRVSLAAPKCRRHVLRLLALSVICSAMVTFVFSPDSVKAEGAIVNVLDYGAKANDGIDDSSAIQAAIDNCPLGGTVVIPSGTYLIRSLVSPKSNITIEGTVGQTILTMPAQSYGNWIFYAANLSNLTISGISLRASSYTDNVGGIFLPGAQNCTLDHLDIQGMTFGIKLGSGDVASGWNITDIVIRESQMPIYMAYVHDSTFTRLNLQAINIPGTNKDHALYMERENRNLTFNDCTLSGGCGYCLHLYMEGGSSSDINFENLTLDSTHGRYPLVIGSGYSSVHFRNTTFRAGQSGPVVTLYGGSDITFDGFSASGGSNLVIASSSVSNVVFSNGSYTGSDLGSGVSFTNVATNSVANTSGSTVPSTSTTTQTTTAPVASSSTTTTAAPVTTTTDTPVTTTTVVTTPVSTVTTTPVTMRISRARLTIRNLKNNQRVAGTLTVSAASTPPLTTASVSSVATASSAQVEKVRFAVDGRWVATDYSAPYYGKVRTNQMAPGSTHIISATAYDGRGRVISVASVKVVAANIVTISNLTEGQEVSGIVNVKATVVSSTRVKVVYFFVDGKWFATDPYAPYAANLDTSKFKPGSTHAIRVQAYDRYWRLINVTTVNVRAPAATLVDPTVTAVT